MIPSVSIIIPTYNHAKFLDTALNSVFAQTFTSWEVIVVNNFSQDNTIEIVNRFNDSRIHLVNFHNNGVIAASRNIGISKASGEWVAFLDSDDVWYPEKLERCMANIIKTDVDAVCHAERWIYTDGYSRDVQYGPEKRSVYCSLLYEGNCISTSAVVVNKQALLAVGGFSENTDFITAEDYDLWLKLSRSNIHFKFLPDILGEFRVHAEGSSQLILKNSRAILNVISEHYTAIKSRNIFDVFKYRKAKALVYYGAARGYQKQNSRKEAFKYFILSMFINPFNSKLYAGLIINMLPLLMKRKLER